MSLGVGVSEWVVLDWWVRVGYVGCGSRRLWVNEWA